MTITVEMIADSISRDGVRLITMQLRYPRFIHAEFMTHRVFSRNASSSRAIPVARMIKSIREDPAIPIHWGKNQVGMQADMENNERVFIPQKVFSKDMSREDAWLNAMDEALMHAEAFDKAGYHKQIVNRLTEPYQHINVVVTSTEWSNFFALRHHLDAMPEICVLAETMLNVQDASVPRELLTGEWHLPYVSDAEYNPKENYTREEINCFIKASVARSARVSYLTHKQKTPTLEEDVKLYERLLGSSPIHASPAEHQAQPDFRRMFKHLHGNFHGWVQYRKTLKGENQ